MNFIINNAYRIHDYLSNPHDNFVLRDKEEIDNKLFTIEINFTLNREDNKILYIINFRFFNDKDDEYKFVHYYIKTHDKDKLIQFLIVLALTKYHKDLDHFILIDEDLVDK